ncbi:MAG: efflux RND transporter periplasmic adaptor subunit [Vicinamibacterales bacterium]
MLTFPRPSFASIHRRLGYASACLVLAALGAACGRGGAAAEGGGPPGGGPPAMPVELLTLEPKAVEQTTEFIGMVKSRRSSTIQPQVEGYVTRIVARPGDRVQPGTLLAEIDSAGQQAAVSSLESQRAARDADLQYARQQAERLKTLFEAGAVSQQESEQAQSALAAGEAQLKAIEAQIREQRVELGYHRVTAPTSGVIGDILVRTGDRVTRSTVLASIESDGGREVHINVPIQQAPRLKVGLPVRIVDERGETIAETTTTFVSPQVDETMQSVLALAALKGPEHFRSDQFVRAEVIWATEPALTVPLVAVNRINGQYFAFVAEAGEGGALVARQRAVDLGALVGNDYVVRSGVKPGEKLIVSGVQKIGDGMPVQAGPPPAAPAAPPVGEGR